MRPLYDPAPRPKKQAIVDPFEQPQNKATTKIVDPFAKAQPKQAAPEAKGGGVMETLGEVAPTVGSTAASAAQATGHIAGGLADVPSSVDRWMDLGNQIAERNNVPDWANPFIALGKVTSTLSEGIDIGDYHAAGTKELGETITQGWKHIGNLLDPQDRRKKNTKKLQDSFDKMISGEGAEDFVQDATNPEILLNNLGQAAPSLYAAIKSGGAPAFIALLETSETEQGAQEFEERTGQEVDPEDFAMAQAQVGLLNTWLERIVPKSIADKLANRSSEKVGGFLRRLWRAFREGGKESGTELVQEWNQNLAQGRFNPEQQATEGLPHAAFGGFGAGTAMRGTAEVLDAASPDNQGPSGDDISGDVDPTQSIFDPETLQPEPGGDEDTMSGVDLTGGAVDEAIDLSGGVMGDEDIQVEEVDYEDIDLSGADTLDTEGMLDIETAVDEAPEQEALRPDEVDRTIAALEGELEKPEIVDPFAGEPEDAQLDTEAIEVEEIQPETVTMREPESVEELDAQAMEAAESPQTDIPEPTEAQKEAGNYKKGKVRLNGMEISIENPGVRRAAERADLVKSGHRP